MSFPIVGRRVGIYIQGSPRVLVLGAKSKSITVNNEFIDTTNDDDEGFRSMLADPATKMIDVSVEGLIKDTSFLTRLTAVNPVLGENLEIDFATIGIISGRFLIGPTYEIGAPYNDQATFSTAFASDGPFTFTEA